MNVRGFKNEKPFNCVKLSATADDVMILINGQKGIDKSIYIVEKSLC